MSVDIKQKDDDGHMLRLTHKNNLFQLCKRTHAPKQLLPEGEGTKSVCEYSLLRLAVFE